MRSETRVPPLRWIFPLAQLFLCAVILWPMRPMFNSQIRASLREYGISHEPAARNPVIPMLRPFDLSDPDVQRRIKISEAREYAVVALNLPGGLPDLTCAILSPTHSGWNPKGMLMWTWRDLSWPIIGIFFWWLAGRGIEALLSSRHRILLPKIRWWEIVVSLPAMAFGAIWAIGLCAGQIVRADFPLWMLLAVFGSMWFILGASTSLAYFVQWRLRRRLASNSVKQTMLISPS